MKTLTSINPSILKAHIEKMNRGNIDFSSIELNNRADLVRFEGFTIEQAASMDESEMYRVLDGASDFEDDEWDCNRYGFSCECGSKNLKMKWVNGWPGRYSSDDGYLCKCECSKEFFIHECALDAMDYEE